MKMAALAFAIIWSMLGWGGAIMMIYFAFTGVIPEQRAFGLCICGIAAPFGAWYFYLEVCEREHSRRLREEFPDLKWDKR